MKLLYVVEDRYPPFRADVVELFARQMPERGHRIDWLMQRGPEAHHETSPTDFLGNTVYLTARSNVRGLRGRVMNNLLGMWGDLTLLRLAFKNRYDVIQVRDKCFASLIALLAARLTGSKFVYWMSFPFAEAKLYAAEKKLTSHPRLTWVKGQMVSLLLYRCILRMADHVFVQSERMRAEVARRGICEAKMAPVPMGITADHVGHANDARAPRTDAPKLLYLGLIHRLRGTEMLVEVLAKVRCAYPGATLCFVGDGQAPEDRCAVEDAARAHGLEAAVHVTGFLSRDKAWEYVREADICLSPLAPIPIFHVASPTKLIEYMAMAKCIVANEHPEQEQVLRDSGVGRCIAWNVQAFADEICRLLSDPEEAKSQAARGPEYVRRHRTYLTIADTVELHYHSLLQSSQQVRLKTNR